jgi:hypothetical protein
MVNLVASLSKQDASSFTALCNFNWTLGEPFDFGPLIYNVEENVYKGNGVDYPSLIELESIGLITLETSGVHLYELPKLVDCSYFDKSVTIEFEDDTKTNHINTGCVVFTTAGMELAPISGCKPSIDIFEHTVRVWKQGGLNVILSS